MPGACAEFLVVASRLLTSGGVLSFYLKPVPLGFSAPPVSPASRPDPSGRFWLKRPRLWASWQPFGLSSSSSFALLLSETQLLFVEPDLEPLRYALKDFLPFGIPSPARGSLLLTVPPLPPSCEVNNGLSAFLVVQVFGV